jgi:hypothetical protein
MLSTAPEPAVGTSATGPLLQSSFSAPQALQHEQLKSQQRPEDTTPPSKTTSSKSPLGDLPLSAVLRSAFILSVSSSPLLLRPCIWALSVLANPQSALTDVDRNPLLNWVVKNTIYKQFNAGENKTEVQQSIVETKGLGCRGVLLGYAREVLVADSNASQHDETLARQEIDTWLQGTLQGVDMATEGDFIALKYVDLLYSNSETRD